MIRRRRPGIAVWGLAAMLLASCAAERADDTVAPTDVTATSSSGAEASSSTTPAVPATATATASRATTTAATTMATVPTIAGAETTATVAEPTTSGAATGGAESDSPFGRRDTPPGGVAAQLEYYAGAEGESCAVVESELPYFAFALTLPPSPSHDLTIGIPYAFCVEGFEKDVPILLEITSPDGSVSTWSVTDVSSGQSDPSFDLLSGGSDTSIPVSIAYGGKWTPEPGAPLGDYTMEATQGALYSTSRFTVVPASEETVTTITDWVSSATGGIHRFAFAGFQPGEQLPVYVYVEDFDNGRRDYVTEIIPPLFMDDRGEALLELVVNPGDPPGTYCLVTPSMLENIPEEVEFGFEYLADPCWTATGDEVSAKGMFWIEE